MIQIIGEYFYLFLKYIVNDANIGIFLVAVLTFMITFKNFYDNRPAIDLVQLDGSASALIKPDFEDLQTPDVYWQYDYRFIVDVIITNKSNKPISVIEFVLNDEFKFNSYQYPGNEYKITTKPKETTINGITTHSQSMTGVFPMNGRWLIPVIDIPPQTSVRGHLFFRVPEKELIKEKGNELKIITSRKTFVKHLDLYELQTSCLSLPDKIQKARSHFS